MVNRTQVMELMEQHFNVSGDWEFDAEARVDVWGHVVSLMRHAPQGRLPVKFGQVSGNFIVDQSDLVTLEGSPREVGGSFRCSSNKLLSLQGAPNQIGKNFICDGNPLISLDGAPDVVEGSFYVDYNPQLPLLRLCMYQKVHIWDVPDLVTEILHKHAGTGRSGALQAAAELIRAGYRENARW